ncbi:hypothetical protein ACFXTH_004967 [Malus domestica]
MWGLFDCTGPWIWFSASPVGRTKEQQLFLGVGNHLPIHDFEIGFDLSILGHCFIRAVEVKIDESWRLMAGSAELVVKRRVRVSVQGRELHASWRVPVPKRQREGRIVYEFGQDSFVEV